MIESPVPPDLTERGAPRQARAIATRATILDAAAHEFAAEGYQAASLSKILERSGVTKGALYFHFASKEAMALAVVEIMQGRFPGVLAVFDVPDRDGLASGVHLAVGLADLLAADVFCRGGLRLTGEGAVGRELASWPHAFWERAFVALLDRAATEGVLRTDVSPLVLARTIVALGVGHRAISTASTRLADLRPRVEGSLELLLDRVASPGWLERWRAAGGLASLPDAAPAVAPGGPAPSASEATSGVPAGGPDAVS